MSCSTQSKIKVFPALLNTVFLLPWLLILNSCESPTHSAQKQLLILLDQADLALQEDRLTIPADESAYYFYSQALSFSPDNPRALDGLKSIQVRYLQLAEQAFKKNDIQKAKEILRRTEKVFPDSKESKALSRKISLYEKRNKKNKLGGKNKAPIKEQGIKYMLSISDLNSKNSNIRKRLLLIGEHAAKTQSKVIIDARNQAEAEWIYKQLRFSATGYQFEKNFRISLYPHIVLLGKAE